MGRGQKIRDWGHDVGMNKKGIGDEGPSQAGPRDNQCRRDRAVDYDLKIAGMSERIQGDWPRIGGCGGGGEAALAKLRIDQTNEGTFTLL